MSLFANRLDRAVGDGIRDSFFITFGDDIGFAFIVEREDLGMGANAQTAADAGVLINAGFGHKSTSVNECIIGRGKAFYNVSNEC